MALGNVRLRLTQLLLLLLRPSQQTSLAIRLARESSTPRQHQHRCSCPAARPAMPLKLRRRLL